MLSKIKTYYKGLSLVAKASIWFICVTIIDKAIAVLTQPVINRILSVDEVGIYSNYNSWYAVFSVLASFNLFGGILEVYLTKEPENKHQVVGSLCSLSVTISFFIFFIVLVFLQPVSRFVELKPIYLFIMAFQIISETIIQFWVVPKRYEYSYKPYALLVISLFAVKCLFSIAFSYLLEQDRVLGRILGLTFPSLVVSVFIIIKIVKNADIQSITCYWKKGLTFNLPLIPHYLATVFLASSDRFMILKLSNETDAGLYAVAYSFSSLALIVFSALNSAYNPFSMKAIKDEKYIDLSKVTESMIFFSVVFSLIMIFLAPEGLYILGGESYLKTQTIIPILVTGIFFSSFYFVFSNIEFVHEKTKYIFPITAVGAGINILLNYILIPLHGYEMAAYTTLVGYIIIAVAHYWVSYRIVGKNVYNIKSLLINVGLLIGGSVAAIMLYDLHFIIRYILVISMLLGIVVYLRNNKSIHRIRNKL